LKAEIVVAANHNLVLVRQGSEPRVERFHILKIAIQSDIAAVNENIPIGHHGEMVAGMSVRDADDSHDFRARFWGGC
jgi:hypothetical protein